MSAKVSFSSNQRVLEIEDQLGFGPVLLRLGYLFILLIVTLGLLPLFEADSRWAHLLGTGGCSLVVYLLMTTVRYRHKVSINAVKRTIRVQRRTGWLSVRTEQFPASLFVGVRTVEIGLAEDVEFQVELVDKNLTQSLMLARFNGKRMETEFFQRLVALGEPIESATLRLTVSKHLGIKDLGCNDD